MDATLKETNIVRSIKKFWIDNFTYAPVYFERRLASAMKKDEIDQWVNVLLYGITPAHVSEIDMNIYMFTKYDSEGDEIVQLRDEVVKLLYPAKIDIFDTEKDLWEKIGGFHIRIDNQSQVIYNPDQSKMVAIMTTLRWGAVWS